MFGSFKRHGALVLFLALLLPLIAACGTAAPAAAPTAAPAAPTAAPAAPTAAPAAPTAAPAMGDGMLPEVDAAAVTGNIISAGSSTVFPLTQKIAEVFKDEGYAGNVTVDSVGTGAGFERFCKAGETDIANASRAIREGEVENCGKIGRTPIEFRVGTDALAVVVSEENTFVKGLNKVQLAQIFSGSVKTWGEVVPEVKGTPDDQPIQLFSPGTDSGTFDYFVEAVMDPTFVKDAKVDAGKGKEAILKAPNIQLSENDNVLAKGVEGSKYAIGYFGFAYFKAEAGKLRAVPVANKDTTDFVEPNEETAESGKYTLARPLFIYSDAKIMKEKPQVAAFINFYLTRVNEVIGEVGYFPASAEALNEAKTKYLEALK